MTAPAITSITPTGGPTAGGTVVTITGTTLTTPTAATINGVAVASFAGIGATSMTVVTPSQATASTGSGTAGAFSPGTAVDIVVTTAGGSSSTGAGDLFDYWDQTFKVGSGQAPAPAPEGKARVVHGYYNLGPSYPTGGFVLVPGLFGFTQVDAVLVGGASLLGKPVAWVPSATAGAGGKLKVFSAIGTEEASGTDLHTDSIMVEVRGR